MFELASLEIQQFVSLRVFVSLSRWSPCPTNARKPPSSGIVPRGASSNELLAWHVLECASVGSLTRVFAASEDGHQCHRVAFRLAVELDRATGHLFFKMTCSFVDQVLVQLDLLRKLMTCLTNSGLHVKW